MKKRIWLVMTWLVTCMSSTLVFSANCKLPLSEEVLMLSMTYENFDQADNGWRKYAKVGCYHEMAILIDKYLDQNKDTLNKWQTIGVTWHAGQLYAFSNEYTIAKIRFTQSIDPNEPANTPLLWNDYVNATIAFIDKDMAKLQLYRDKIANGPTINGKKANLNVVESLVNYFGQPYSVAYCAAEDE